MSIYLLEMNVSPRGRLSPSRWGLILFVCLLIGVTFAVQGFIYANQKGYPLSWRDSFTEQIPFWLVWGLLAPVIFRFIQHVPLDRERWFINVLKHVPASIVFSVIHLTLYMLILAVLRERDLMESSKSMNTFIALITRLNFGMRMWSYLMLAAFAYAADFYQRYQEGTMRTSQLETQLAQAQLQALKMQLHPHFLFNTLNSISALLHKNPEAADRMIARLGDFLRLTLRNSGTQEVTMQQELEFLKCYLDIERIRFQDRLTVEINVQPEASTARVPNLILQPVVENAIRHGIVTHNEPGRIEISAQCVNGWLEMKVTDNGPGLARSKDGTVDITEGVGIKNTRSRLQQLYGETYRFELADASGGGLEVRVRIPLRIEASTEASINEYTTTN
ncbi:histidine kinase [bacterium]|nr:histidine kinase [bacterium]